jgi:hypothetical protein
MRTHTLSIRQNQVSPLPQCTLSCCICKSKTQCHVAVVRRSIFTDFPSIPCIWRLLQDIIMVRIGQHICQHPRRHTGPPNSCTQETSYENLQ